MKKGEQATGSAASNAFKALIKAAATLNPLRSEPAYAAR